MWERQHCVCGPSANIFIYQREIVFDWSVKHFCKNFQEKAFIYETPITMGRYVLVTFPRPGFALGEAILLASGAFGALQGY